MPQIRGSAERFISRVLPENGRTALRTRPLEALIIGGWVRGLSDRDIEPLDPRSPAPVEADWVWGRRDLAPARSPSACGGDRTAPADQDRALRCHRNDAPRAAARAEERHCQSNKGASPQHPQRGDPRRPGLQKRRGTGAAPSDIGRHHRQSRCQPRTWHPSSISPGQSADGPLWLFLLGTGCRVGEALALTWEMVDFESGLIRFEKELRRERIDGAWRYIVQDPKTADLRPDKAKRTVGVPKFVIRALDASGTASDETSMGKSLGRDIRELGLQHADGETGKQFGPRPPF